MSGCRFSVSHQSYGPATSSELSSPIVSGLYGPDKKKTGTHIARNDNGKTYYVPADMTYKEWQESKFIVTDTAFMSKFSAQYGKTSVLKLTQSTINVKSVSNSQFKLYAESKASSKERAVIFAENQLRKAKAYLPDDFIIPKVVVIDFAKVWPGVKAIGAYNKDLDTVFINSKYDIEAKVMKFLAADTDGRGDTVYANMTSLAPYLHELGHAYYNQRIKKLVEEENRSYTKIKNEIDNAIGTIISEKIKRNDDFLKQKISVYAWIGYKNHKYGEIIAECFSIRLSKKGLCICC